MRIAPGTSRRQAVHNLCRGEDHPGRAQLGSLGLPDLHSQPLVPGLLHWKFISDYSS